MSHLFNILVTYSSHVYEDETLEEEHGFLEEDGKYSFEELVNKLQSGFIHPSMSPLPVNNLENVWFSTEGETDFKTGWNTVESIHFNDHRVKYWKWALIMSGLMPKS